MFAVLLRHGMPLPVAALGAIATGAAAGALTAYLHVRFRLNKFLAGIIVVAITYSLSLRIMGGANIGLLQLPSIFDWVKGWDQLSGGWFHAGSALLLFTCIVVCSGLAAVGLSSRRGLGLRVAGSNPEYARALGLNVSANLVVGLAITNGMSATAGVFMAMQQGFVDVGMGQGVLIISLAAMTLGERMLPQKRLPFHYVVILAAIIGSVLYQVIVAYAVRLGLAASDLKLVTAVVVLGVVAMRASNDGEVFADTPK